jgi:predicted lipoprotein with Yx(FWY)xxD motif
MTKAGRVETKAVGPAAAGVRRARFVAFAVLGAVIVGAAACSSGSSSSTTTSPPTTTGNHATTSTTAAPGTPTSSSSSPVVDVAHLGATGLVLVNRSGLTLYRYTPDGTGKSTCNAGCDTAWPPLTVPAGTAKVIGSPALAGGSLGTITRSDGTLQVTYKGMPLYTYTGDMAAGQANGQGAGGIWFVVPVTASHTASGSSTSTTTTSSSGYGSGY